MLGVVSGRLFSVPVVLAAALVGCGGGRELPAPASAGGAASASSQPPGLSRTDPGGGGGDRTSAASEAELRYRRVLERVRALAAQRAVGPPAPPPPPLPAGLADIDYDQARMLRFRPEASLWRGAGHDVEVQLFHRSPFSRDRVTVHLVDPAGDEIPVPYDPDRFEVPRSLDLSPEERADLGYAGLRVHGPIHGRDYLDEILVFLGASYFRSLGPRQGYGTSARGLAVDLGLASGEEFPRFTDLWLVEPSPSGTVRLVALLDGRRVTGAYGFTVSLGAEATHLDVDARVYLRAPVDALGLAPMSSMFLFGEASPARFGDFRPEVHDADGLAVWAGNGERLWRPLDNPEGTRTSDLAFDGVRGFGLLQRDRAFDHYQDLEARYERRPSVWVTPRGDWGSGVLRLLEIQTELETDDNVALCWVPDAPPSVGEPFDVAYRVSFGRLPAASPPWRVTATRRTRPRDASAGTRFVIDFDLEGPVPPLEALSLVVSADQPEVRIDDVRVEALPTAAEASGETRPGSARGGRVRGTFVARLAAPLPPGTANLRAFLRGPTAASETWTRIWRPDR